MNFEPTATEYTSALRLHYEGYFGLAGRKILWQAGPTHKLHPNFHILEFPPGAVCSMWSYHTVGMALTNGGEEPLELFLYAPYQDASLAEVLTVMASFHRNKASLGLHHTVNLGQPWLAQSTCCYAFISLPYVEGEALKVCSFAPYNVGCYWVIPITEQERKYKKANGWEALEQLFEDGPIDYLAIHRASLV